MTLWHATVITLFPEMFPGPLAFALAGKARDNGVWDMNCVNPRDFATDPHKTVDDTPFGGGAGMILKPDILERAILSVQSGPSGQARGPQALESSPSGLSRGPQAARDPRVTPEDLGSKRIYLSARGRKLTQKIVQELAQTPHVTLLCGRYEGVDQRVLDAYGFDEICVGDYVLSGGEVAALTLMDACIRLLPGVMGNTQTAGDESFTDPTRLEYPHYTRPAVWTDARGAAHPVPDILTSGDHGKVAKWRAEQATAHTAKMRPDLLPPGK
jgi:tRNA (guanine37-N1)-methyltransferase